MQYIDLVSRITFVVIRDQRCRFNIINNICYTQYIYAGTITNSPSETSFLDSSARDSRGLLILRKRSCDKSATKCIAVQKRRSMESIKNRYFYMFILYKLFTRVFEFQLILRDKIF